MAIKIILFVFFSISGISISAQTFRSAIAPENNYVERDIPNNSDSLIKATYTKSEFVYNYKIRKGKIKDSSLLSVTYFDEEGRIISGKMQGKNKKVYDTAVYDATGRIIFFNYHNSGQTPTWFFHSRKLEYKYENKRSFVRFIEKKDSSEWLEFYEIKNVFNQTILYLGWRSPEKFLYEKYLYDSLQRISNTIVMNQAGNTYFEIIHKYENNNVVTISQHIGDSLYFYKENHYNEKHQLILCRRNGYDVNYAYNSDGTLYQSDFTVFGKVYFTRSYYFKQ